MRLLSSARLVRVALALVVAFWMAGAGCLLGCENMIAGAAAQESESATALTIVATGDACAAMQSHDCCARHARKSAARHPSASASRAGFESHPATAVTSAVEFSGTSTMIDCPLAITATAALSKARPDTSSVALAQAGSIAHLPPLREQARSLSEPQLLPNRGHTYLRCCVFLI
jgi:hypothetical protein